MVEPNFVNGAYSGELSLVDHVAETFASQIKYH